MTERLILAIDTSFGPVGVTLTTFDKRIISCVEADNPAGTQAETLPPFVAKMFEGHDFKRLARVAVTVGPGAFTGVRVGLAFAKGLRLATGAEVLGFTTLDCLAAQAAASIPCDSVGTVIDAKRGEVYVQAFSGACEALCEAQVLPVAEAAALLRRTLKPPALLTGSGAMLVGDVGHSRIVEAARIDTQLLAWRAVDADPARHPPTPVYLRAPDARLPT